MGGLCIFLTRHTKTFHLALLCSHWGKMDNWSKKSFSACLYKFDALV